MDNLLELAQTKGTPLVEGDQAIFVWRGKKPPELIGDFNDWDQPYPVAWQPVGPKLWAAALTLPPDAYIEYAFEKNGERLSDPFNPRIVPNGLGRENHFFYMPEAKPTPLAVRVEDIPHGTVTRYKIATEEYADGKKRRLFLYAPPTQEPCPLLVVLDGRDYLRRAQLVNLVDNLIAQNRIRPIAMALVANGGLARDVEYSCSEATLAFLAERVVPFAESALNLLPVWQVPGGYGILGASLGGVMALFAGVRLPSLFSTIITQSGAFAYYDFDSVLFDLIRLEKPLPLKIWMDAGQFEELALANRQMYDLLSLRGYSVTYREFPGGHNYTAWRNDVWRGLESFYSAE